MTCGAFAIYSGDIQGEREIAAIKRLVVGNFLGDLPNMGVMTTACAKYQDPNIYAICSKMVDRFSVTEAEIERRGGLLNTAIYHADQEYLKSLPRSEADNWIRPRQRRDSFVNFLDKHSFIIPWYLETRTYVQQIEAHAIAAAEECDLSSRECVLSKMPTLWMDRKSGWGITLALALNHERTVDQTIKSQEATCSEWSKVQFSTAIILGADFSAEIFLGKNPHIEPYIKLDDNTYWNQRLTQGGTQTLPTQTSSIKAIPKSDIALAMHINKIAFRDGRHKEWRNEIAQIYPMIESPTVQAFAQLMMGLHASHASMPCEAKTHFANVVSNKKLPEEFIGMVRSYMASAATYCISTRASQ